MAHDSTVEEEKPQLPCAVPETVSPALYGQSLAHLKGTETETLSQARRVAIAALVILTNLVPVTSFGAGMGGGIAIAKDLGVERPSEASWIAASYPLTQGAFVLMTGRLGCIYGHKNILCLGAAWWVLWTLVNGFCNNFIAFNIARALSGIGSAMIVPNAIAIIGITYSPGRTRNLIFGLLGAGMPIGGWSGALFAGVFTELADWKWLFVFLALLGTLIFGALALVLPSETPVSKAEKMDWGGAFLGITAMITFNIVFNQAPTTRWNSPSEIALLVSSFLLFASFAIWEQKFAAQPILPLTIWKAPSFFALVLVVLFTFMSFGTFIWYIIAWQQTVRHWSVLSVAAGLLPIPICSAAAAFLSAWLIPRLAAQWILAIGAASIVIAQVLIATMPSQQSYWAQVFPATIIHTLCPDFIFTAGQIIASNSVRRQEQGIAASLIALIQLYGTSIGLGFAGIVETHTNDGGNSLVTGYRSALYLGIGLGVVALVASAFFVRMPKDEREGWQAEDSVPSAAGRECSAV